MENSLMGLSKALMLAAAVGCAADEVPPSTAADSATNAPAVAGTITGANVVTIRARDFAFEGPTEIPAGLTTFRLANAGPDIHHAQIIKLDEGKTGADFAAAIKAGGPPPSWAQVAGGPNVPLPGHESNATSVLAPGNYALVCFVDTPDKVPHMLKGMVHNFRVVAASTPVAPDPTPTTTIDMKDFAFDLPINLAAGAHTFRVVNSGAQPHEVQLFKMMPGKTMRDLQAWAHSLAGPPPAAPIGGVVALPPTGHAFFTASLDAGDYVLFCFFPDPATKKLHFDLGMMKTVKVS